jgi:preprotein translocase subunit SecE
MIQKLKRIPEFFREVKEELKKVNWSTRKELIGAVVVVMVVSAFLTAYIAVVDWGLSKLIEFVIR